MKDENRWWEFNKLVHDMLLVPPSDWPFDLAIKLERFVRGWSRDLDELSALRTEFRKLLGDVITVSAPTEKEHET